MFGKRIRVKDEGAFKDAIIKLVESYTGKKLDLNQITELNIRIKADLEKQPEILFYGRY